jgi:hypothetical protein
MTKKGKFELRPFVSRGENGWEGGAMVAYKKDDVGIEFSGKHNFSRKKSEVKTNVTTDLGDTEITLVGEGRGIYHQFPDSIKKYVIGGSALIGLLCGLQYLTGSSLDVYQKIAGLVASTAILSLVGIYVGNKLSKKIRIV